MSGEERNQSFPWETLVPHLVHPAKVAIIEAFDRLEMPLSAVELDRMLDEEYGLSGIAYHMRTLVEAGALEKVGERVVRGALQTFYALSAKEVAQRDFSPR